MDRDCIFCKITRHEAPADIVHESDSVVVFPSIHPSAPVHLLVVPKRHIPSVADFTEDDRKDIADIVLAAVVVAKEKGLEGYKLVYNVGRKGGQVIDHVHLHVLGGWQGDAGE